MSTDRIEPNDEAINRVIAGLRQHIAAYSAELIKVDIVPIIAFATREGYPGDVIAHLARLNREHYERRATMLRSSIERCEKLIDDCCAMMLIPG